MPGGPPEDKEEDLDVEGVEYEEDVGFDMVWRCVEYRSLYLLVRSSVLSSKV